MFNVFGDLHIHIGTAGGRPVKITASRKLDLQSIIYRDAPRKGLNMVGIVDAGSTLVAAELEQMVTAGELTEHPRGGFIARNGVLLITGCEVESREGIHLILYLPFIKSLKKYQKYIRSRVTNMELSTQKVNAGIIDLINLSYLLDGVFCPAHAFTPHKGIYGVWTDRLAKGLGREASHIKVLELGLSADTSMADMIGETREFTFLSNSDAHSSENIGREYNLFRMASLSFEEFKQSLNNEGGRRIVANYGMNPLLGKYHRSFCPECSTIASDPPPVFSCHSCGNEKMVMGVWDRIAAIRDYEQPQSPISRPPYYYRVPLKGLPGVGPKMMQKLLDWFDNEIDIIEKVNVDEIERIAGAQTAEMIKRMSTGRLNIIPGGGGRYGKVKKDNCN